MMDKYSHGPPDSDFMELGGASRDDDAVQWLAEIGWRHTSQWSTLNDSWNYSVDLLPAQSCPLLSSLSDSDTHRLFLLLRREKKFHHQQFRQTFTNTKEQSPKRTPVD